MSAATAACCCFYLTVLDSITMSNEDRLKQIFRIDNFQPIEKCLNVTAHFLKLRFRAL